ncbi:MAG: (d)CMP kinase, partial [Chloroflexi bacterium]|nr:(d)CMP kinase [Chloroflexota bacterium]
QSSSIIRLLVDGEDVTSQLHTPEIGSLVSHVSQWPAVRQKLAQEQRKLAQQGNFVLAGRDIGTIVLPDADLKVFLTASLDERIARRLAERRRVDPTTSAETVRAELIARDTLDSHRKASPLRIASDAHILDTTHISIEEAVAQVLSWIKQEQDR